MEFGPLQWIVEGLNNLLDRISNRNKALEEEEKRAVEAFQLALNETLLFLGTPSHKQSVWSPQQEQRLSRLWLNAALAVRAIDPDLAERCRMKASYWADPTTWSQEDLNKAKILISQVYLEAARLIRGPVKN